MKRSLATRSCFPIFFAFLVAFIALSSVQAETVAEHQQIITLESLIADVLKNNAELQYYKSEIAEAKGEHTTAGVWSNPELSSAYGKKRVSTNSGDESGAAWTISIQQTFEWPGRIELRKLIASKQLELAKLGLTQFESALVSKARILAYDIQVSQEKVDATKGVTSRYKDLKDVLSKREIAGVTPLLEKRIIEASSLSLERKANEIELARKFAILKLNELRGRSGTADIKIKTTKLDMVAPPPSEILIAAARSNDFELRLRQTQLEQQRLKVNLAKNERYPAVSVGPYFAQERVGNKEMQIGIGLSLPLPFWNRNSGQIVSEEARKQQAASALLVAQRDIERQVIEALETFNTKMSEMKRWSEDTLTEFNEAARLSDEHFRLGAVPIATYVELQKQYLEAVDAIFSIRREVFAAKQELERLTGLKFGNSL